MQTKRKEGEGAKETAEKEQRPDWSQWPGGHGSKIRGAASWLSGPSKRTLDGLDLKSALWGTEKRNEPLSVRPNERAAAFGQ